MVKKAVGGALQVLTPTFSRVLVLMVGFTLPVLDEKVAQDVLDFSTDFNLCAVTDELVWGAPRSRMTS